MKKRNGSNETVVDYLTGRTAEPDEVIDVPDAWAAAYEGHPVWEDVPDVPASIRAASPATAPPAADTTNDSPEEVTP